MAKIAVDPGHGVNTPGKRTAKAVPKYGRVIKEYEFNKPTAQCLKAALERHGHTVVYTGADSDPSLSSRCKKANDAKADLFISIHYNAGGGHGVETFVIGRGGNAEKLAKKVQPNLVKVRNQANRGVKVANFQVLRDTKMPAILCECGFMDDPRGIEQSWMLDKAFQKDVAEAICKGVQEHLGKAYKAPGGSKPAPNPAPKPPAWTKEQQEQIARLNPAPKPAGVKFTRTLKYVAGKQMEGNDVLAVQYKIGVKPYKDDKTGKVIGTFGPLTRDALKAWQKKNGIKETGEVGIVNWRKMFGEKKEDPKPAPKPKDTVHRVIVDGKQVGAYGVNKNAANAVEDALDKGAKKINVEEAK